MFSSLNAPRVSPVCSTFAGTTAVVYNAISLCRLQKNAEANARHGHVLGTLQRPKFLKHWQDAVCLIEACSAIELCFSNYSELFHQKK